jgi:hypothetical protein
VIVLFLTAELAQAVLLVVPPPPLVERCPLVVVVNPVTVLQSLPKRSFEDLSTAKNVHALTVEIVIFPISEIHVSDRIIKNSFPVPELFCRELAHILAIWKCHLFNILQQFERNEELPLLGLELVEEIDVSRFYGRVVDVCEVAHVTTLYISY